MNDDVMKILGLTPGPTSNTDTTEASANTVALAPPTSPNSETVANIFNNMEDDALVPQVSPDVERLQQDTDYILSRKTNQVLSKAADIAVSGALVVADGSGSPRAYEVVAQLLKTASELNAQRMDLHLKRQKLKENQDDEDAVPKSGTNIERAIVFQGNSRDLLKMAKELAKDVTTDAAPIDAVVVEHHGEEKQETV